MLTLSLINTEVLSLCAMFHLHAHTPRSAHSPVTAHASWRSG